MAPTLVASRTALPPEGALRLRPGPSTGSGQAKAGSAAPARVKRTSGDETMLTARLFEGLVR